MKEVGGTGWLVGGKGREEEEEGREKGVSRVGGCEEVLEGEG